MRGTLAEIGQALDWVAAQPQEFKVVIPGNHDFAFQNDPVRATELALSRGIILLNNSDFTIKGLRFWGSPWTPWFYDWAFNFPKGDVEAARRTWKKIPYDAAVVITHGPAYDILDECVDGRTVGCPELYERLMAVQPKLHVCGHIHHSYGRKQLFSPPTGTIFVNASTCNERYEAVNDPIVVEV